MNNVINIGCDSGYGYTMSSSSFGESKFSSYIQKVTKRKAMEIKESVDTFDEENLLVEYMGNYYIMGRLCEKHYMDSTRRIDLNRVGDIYHLVQLLTSVSVNVKELNKIKVNLMVGLPIRSRDDRGAFRDWLEEKRFNITFLTKNREHKKIIDINKCHCFLQPIFPIFSALIPEDQVKNILSLDIGYSSTDGVRFEDGGMSESNQDQIDLIGTHKIITELEDEIIGKYKPTYNHLLSIPERSLQIALETGEFNINNRSVDIEDILNDVIEGYVDYIFTELQRRYIQKLSNIDIILVSGGLACSPIFMKKLASRFREYMITVAATDEPQWDICRGMNILLNELEEVDIAEESLDQVMPDVK